MLSNVKRNIMKAAIVTLITEMFNGNVTCEHVNDSSYWCFSAQEKHNARFEQYSPQAELFQSDTLIANLTTNLHL